MEHFFPRIQVEILRSDAHQGQIIRGNADQDHTQIIGGIQSNYWGGYISPSPPGFRHPWRQPCSVAKYVRAIMNKSSAFQQVLYLKLSKIVV